MSANRVLGIYLEAATLHEDYSDDGPYYTGDLP